MKAQTQPTQSAVAARLGSSHGYRFDGDTVFINASFVADAGADQGRSWSLRLVAGTDALAGHVITEVALPPLSELTGAVENYEVAAGALYPAAQGFHLITLALVARDTAGNVELHDTFTYELSQSFAQPRLAGAIGFWFESDTELVLDVDQIENHRADDNLSGTLSLEVWALDHAYAGGQFEGQPVAGALLGELAGGRLWTPAAMHLRATKPAAGSHLVVMLREWNGAAYVTRDFVSFAPAPVAAPVATSVSESKSAAVVETPAAAPVVGPVAVAPTSMVSKAVESVKTALAAVVTAASEPSKAKSQSTDKSKASKAPVAAKAEKPAAKSKKKSK
ncbi:MAG: hypothetical protein WC205_05390 [Opitutaceae bacterium]|jgi:hypothetical protein